MTCQAGIVCVCVCVWESEWVSERMEMLYSPCICSPPHHGSTLAWLNEWAHTQPALRGVWFFHALINSSFDTWIPNERKQSCFNRAALPVLCFTPWALLAPPRVTLSIRPLWKTAGSSQLSPVLPYFTPPLFFLSPDLFLLSVPPVLKPAPPFFPVAHYSHVCFSPSTFSITAQTSCPPVTPFCSHPRLHSCSSPPPTQTRTHYLFILSSLRR